MLRSGLTPRTAYGKGGNHGISADDPHALMARIKEGMMKGMVVYKSWWGSCMKIAEVIGEGLSESGHEVRVVAIEDAGPPDPSLDFIVIGAATRWPGAWPKVKRYAKKVIKAGFAGKPFATFSTGGSVNEGAPLTQASEVLNLSTIKQWLAGQTPIEKTFGELGVLSLAKLPKRKHAHALV